jgi:NDP-sugar pyrophosphorylase family protein
MRHIDYGLSICSRSLLERHTGDQVFDLASLFEALSEERALAGFEVTRRFYEIGSPEGLRELDRLFRFAEGTDPKKGF